MTQQAASQSMPPFDGGSVARAHEALLHDKSIQFDIKAMEMSPPPAWLIEFLKFFTSPMGKIVLWTVGGIIALLVVWLILHLLFGLRLPWKRRGREKAAAEENWQIEAGPARALLLEADTLAAAGRFSEAAHLLLFRSIEDIESRRPKLVRPALTSRDIAGASEIPPPARTAFGAIVMMVERSLFGGRQLAEPDWRECRSAYERFAFAEAWR